MEVIEIVDDAAAGWLVEQAGTVAVESATPDSTC